MLKANNQNKRKKNLNPHPRKEHHMKNNHLRKLTVILLTLMLCCAATAQSATAASLDIYDIMQSITSIENLEGKKIAEKTINMMISDHEYGKDYNNQIIKFLINEKMVEPTERSKVRGRGYNDEYEITDKGDNYISASGQLALLRQDHKDNKSDFLTMKNIKIPMKVTEVLVDKQNNLAKVIISEQGMVFDPIFKPIENVLRRIEKPGGRMVAIYKKYDKGWRFEGWGR